MELLRQLSNFTRSRQDKLQIYKVYIRSVLEQSSVVWNSSLTKKNEREMERVQKVAVRLIMGEDTKYEESLKILKLTSLKENRNLLSVKFAEKCLANKNTRSIFTRNINPHQMKLRKTEHFKIKHARTERMKKSAIINMTKQLNSQFEERKRIFKKY